MKVFAYEVTEGTDWISPVPGKAQRQLRELKTQFAPVLDSWNPPTYEYVGRRRSRSADFPWDGYGNLCLRQTAIDVVGHVLKPFGEFLPLALGDEERVWLFHPIGVIPALDLNESSLETFPDGTVGNIDTFHFVEDLVGSRPIFRVPQRVRPFVTDAFVDRVRSSNLTGLRFQLLWDSAWTVRPVPLLIVSGYWSPRGWDEAESARRTRTFLTQLGALDPALQVWRRRGRGPLKEQAVAMPLTDAAVATALARLKERDRNADAIYHDGGIWNTPHEEISVELQQATGTGQRFVNSPWGGVAHLRMFDLRETHTRHATVDGMLALFAAMRAAWPVEHLVARTELFQGHDELTHYPMLGWITWLTAQGRVADRDPVLPAGVQILDRTATTLTLQLSPTLDTLSAETVHQTIRLLEEQRWLVRQPDKLHRA